MKIVDVAESYSERGGGVRTYIHHKLAAAARMGVECVVVAPGTRAREQRVEGGRIVWVKSRRSPFDERYGLFDDEAAVHRVLDREAPDLVEGSSPWNGGKFVGSYRAPVAKAFVFHTDPVAVWPQTFLGRRLGFERVDRLCAPLWTRIGRLAEAFDTTVVSGEWLAQRLRRFGVPRPSVVDFGIDKRRFSPAHRDPQLRRRLLASCGVPESGKLLVAVSRLDPEKRIGTIIDGFARARREQPMGLVIFGRGALQRYYARRAQRTRGVYLHGYVSERDGIARALACADGLVHGSAAETYGLVVAEAVCSGAAVVVPDRGGAAALAGPDYAECYPPGDARGCARAITRLLNREPGALAAGCAAAALDIGTMDDHFRRLFALYAQLSRGSAVGISSVRPGSLRVAS